MAFLTDIFSDEKIRVRDVVIGVVIILLFAVLGMLLRVKPDMSPMVISNFGPKQIPAENLAAKSTFPMWFVVDHLSASSRLVIDGQPVPSVVDMSAHAITAMVPPADFIEDGSLSIRVTDAVTDRRSNEIVVGK